MRGSTGRLAVSLGVSVAVAAVAGCTDAMPVRAASASTEGQALKNKKQGWDRTIENNAERLIEDGREIFRFDSFGSEAFWGDTLGLHTAIAGAANGGVGPGVSPATALGVGLKVDVEALPKKVQRAIVNDPVKYPLAVSQGLFDLRPPQDLVPAKLPALQLYQLSIPAPKPLPGTFDPVAAERGEAVFNGKAQCARCHVPPLYSEPDWAMHSGAEIGIDEFQAERSPDGKYRTTPLAGLFTRAKGGFYHDGRFADYAAVVSHYDRHFGLGLNAAESADLVEFLKSL